MPTIEEYDDPDEVMLAPPSTAAAGAASSSSTLPYRTVTAESVKGWTVLYPIYIDAKRPHAKGARRVPKSHAVEWPLAEQMNRACMLLGFQSVFEPNKGHPKDWDNPGRVRVLLYDDGEAGAGSTTTRRTPAHRTIKTKLDLLKRIGFALKQMQQKQVSSGERPVPAIEDRLPAHSPAISIGILDQSIAGKGPFANMFPGLTGGPNDGDGDGDAQAAPPAKQQPKIIKPKKVHIRRR